MMTSKRFDCRRAAVGLGVGLAFGAVLGAAPVSATPNVYDPSSYAFASALGANVTQVQTEMKNGVIGNSFDQTSGSTRTTAASPDGWLNSAGVVSNIGVAVSSTADLHTGTVRSSVDNGNIQTPRGFGEARIQDTVFFNNTSGATVYLPFAFSFDGSIVNAPDTSNATAIFSISGARECTDLTYTSCGNTLSLQNGGNVNNTTVIGYMGDGSPNGVQQGGAFFFGAPDNVDLANYVVFKDWQQGNGFYNTIVSSVLAVPVGASRLGFDLRLIVDCWVHINAQCDFGNTSQFGFGALPTGLSFNSASGVFGATNTGGGVPEPASWAMLITGLGLTGAMLRRRRRIVAA